MSFEMSISQKQLGVYIISLNGVVDASCGKELQTKIETIIDPATKTLILDIKGVENITNEGAESFNSIDSLLKESHIELFILKPDVVTDKFSRISRMSSVKRILNKIEDVEDYISKL